MGREPLTQPRARDQMLWSGDLVDEIQAAVVVSHGGRLVNPRVRAAWAT